MLVLTSWHADRNAGCRRRVGWLSPPGPLRGAAFILSIAFAAGCQRTPEEPAPARAPASQSRAEPVVDQTPKPPPPPATRLVVPPSPEPGDDYALELPPLPSTIVQGRCLSPTPASAPGPVPPPAASCPPDPQRGGAPLPVVALSIPEASATLKAELARREDETERGLMYRAQMPEDRGMLFLMSKRRVQTFWMKNTCIPLDMMFVDDDGTIVGIYENVPPMTRHSRAVACESRWVLETNAGWARRHGVKAGQKLILPREGQ